MMKILKLGFFLCLLLSMTLPGIAQTRFQTGVFFGLSSPQGEFGEYATQLSYGGAINFTYHLPDSLISLGAVLDYSIYGYESWEEPLSLTLADIWVDVSTYNAMFMGHFIVRLQPNQGYIRPYLDGLFGFKHLRTDTRISDADNYGDDDIGTTNHLSDTALSYGAGAGVMLPLFMKINRHSRRSFFSIALDLGVRYLKGGRAEYLIEGAIDSQNDRLIYNVSQSYTDLFTAYLGLTFSF